MKDIKEFINEAKRFVPGIGYCNITVKPTDGLTYDEQLIFKGWFFRNLKKMKIMDDKEFEKFKKSDPFYFDNTECIDAEKGNSIPGVECDGSMNFGEASDKLIEYFGLAKK